MAEDWTDLGNEEATEKWFEAQSTEVRSVIAGRAALRVLGVLSFSDESKQDWVLLSVFRCLLLSAVRGLERSAHSQLLETASRSSRRLIDFAARSTIRSTSLAVLSAASSAAGAANSAKFAASSTKRSAETVERSAKGPEARSFITSSIKWDCQNNTHYLLAEPLWKGAEVPNGIQIQHDFFLALLHQKPNWDFFHRWYAQMWDGTFRDWDLAIAVATLDPELWEGEDALAKVAEAIRGIEARRALKRAISELRGSSEIVPEEEVRMHRGHNNPPELIDAPLLVARREIVWAAIDDLEREAESETPKKDLVRRSLDLVTRWLRDVLAFLGRKADLTIDQVIKWGLPMGGTYLLAHPAKLQQIIEAGKAWLPFLP